MLQSNKKEPLEITCWACEKFEFRVLNFLEVFAISFREKLSAHSGIQQDWSRPKVSDWVFKLGNQYFSQTDPKPLNTRLWGRKYRIKNYLFLTFATHSSQGHPQIIHVEDYHSRILLGLFYGAQLYPSPFEWLLIQSKPISRTCHSYSKFKQFPFVCDKGSGNDKCHPFFQQYPL